MFQASSAQSSGSTSSSISRSFSSAQSMNSDSRIWPPPFLSILANSASMSSMGPTHWKSYMDVKRVRRIWRCNDISESISDIICYLLDGLLHLVRGELLLVHPLVLARVQSDNIIITVRYNTVQYSTVQNSTLQYNDSLVTWRGENSKRILDPT